MESKMIAGPWEAVPTRIDGYVFSVLGPTTKRNGKPVIADICDHDNVDCAAHASLIAAAPEMLDELRHLHAIIQPWLDSGNSIPGLATMNKSAAILAKATA
jgi:hypothetical protein